MSRIIPVVAVVALLAAACGVERTSEDVLPADSDDAATAESSVPEDVSGDEATTPTTLAPVAPPTTGVPDEVALSADFGDGMLEITHGEMNDIVVPTQENEEFVTLVFGGGRPPGFDAIVLGEQLVFGALDLEIDAAGASVTDADVEDSKQRLLGQLATLYGGSPDPAAEAERLYDEVPYLQFLVGYQAGQDVLTAAIVDAAEPGEGQPCVSHILVETEEEAQTALERLADGEDFAALAAELSTGPSGPNGGELGCAPSSGYVPEFAAAVDAAELGEYVGPVQTEFGYHVLVVDRFEVDGRNLAAERIRTRLTEAQVDVDDAVGTWDPAQLRIIPVGA